MLSISSIKLLANYIKAGRPFTLVEAVQAYMNIDALSGLSQTSGDGDRLGITGAANSVVVTHAADALKDLADRHEGAFIKKFIDILYMLIDQSATPAKINYGEGNSPAIYLRTLQSPKSPNYDRQAYWRIANHHENNVNWTRYNSKTYDAQGFVAAPIGSKEADRAVAAGAVPSPQYNHDNNANWHVSISIVGDGMYSPGMSNSSSDAHLDPIPRVDYYFDPKTRKRLRYPREDNSVHSGKLSYIALTINLDENEGFRKIVDLYMDAKTLPDSELEQIANTLDYDEKLTAEMVQSLCAFALVGWCHGLIEAIERTETGTELQSIVELKEVFLNHLHEPLDDDACDVLDIKSPTAIVNLIVDGDDKSSNANHPKWDKWTDLEYQGRKPRYYPGLGQYDTRVERDAYLDTMSGFTPTYAEIGLKQGLQKTKSDPKKILKYVIDHPLLIPRLLNRPLDTPDIFGRDTIPNILVRMIMEQLNAEMAANCGMNTTIDERKLVAANMYNNSSMVAQLTNEIAQLVDREYIRRSIDSQLFEHYKNNHSYFKALTRGADRLDDMLKFIKTVESFVGELTAVRKQATDLRTFGPALRRMVRQASAAPETKKYTGYGVAAAIRDPKLASRIYKPLIKEKMDEIIKAIKTDGISVAEGMIDTAILDTLSFVSDSTADDHMSNLERAMRSLVRKAVDAHPSILTSMPLKSADDAYEMLKQASDYMAQYNDTSSAVIKHLHDFMLDPNTDALTYTRDAVSAHRNDPSIATALAALQLV